MKQITRNVDLVHVRDLLERVPRACIAYASDKGPQVIPVALAWIDKRYLVGIPDRVEHGPGAGEEIVLLVDEGVYFFELRAVYVRGRLQPATSPPNTPTGHTWLELVPLREVAWDYGSLREEDDAS